MTLAVSQLRVDFDGRSVLQDVDMTLRPGMVTAIVGPNGVGKSTLLSVLAGLRSPTSGHVELDSMDLQSLPAVTRARRLAYLPQHSEVVWPVTVATLVSLARIPHRGLTTARQDAEFVAGALRRTDVVGFAERAVDSLSGGERARVMLARLIAGNPEWLLADEPFAGLDPAHQFDAASLLRSLAREGRGVVITVHDLTLAANLAERVIVLSLGRIVADGLPQHALTSSLLRDVYDVDAEWLTIGNAPFIAIHRRQTA